MLRKVKQDIDAIVKHGHLPDFEDEPSLPFITAIVKETMRWRDVAPIGARVSCLQFISLTYRQWEYPGTSKLRMNTKGI